MAIFPLLLEFEIIARSSQTPGRHSKDRVMMKGARMPKMIS